MKIFGVSLFVVMGLVGVALGGSSTAGKKSEKFQKIHTPELVQLLENTPPGKLAIYDANSEKTRKTDGMIPDAKPLSSHSDYDVATELPADHNVKLVFYCYNEKCTASHAAAKKAMGEGYTQVAVLTDGIYGWIKSGQKVVKPR